MKKEGRKIVMVTAYTFFQARVADEAGVDGILVGDSLGMVIMGYSSTLPVSMEEVMHSVRRLVGRRLLGMQGGSLSWGRTPLRLRAV